MSTVMKIIGSIILTGGMLYYGLLMTFLLAWTFNFGGVALKIYFILGVLLWLFLMIKIWKWDFKPKMMNIFGLLVVVAMVLPIVGNRVVNFYRNSIAIEEQFGGNYNPFNENSIVARLDEPSALKLTDDLPRLDGATALYPVYAAFVGAVYPDGKNITCTQTDVAYYNLIHGNTDIIFVAGASKEQMKEAEKANVELNFTPIGREAFVFFVNRKNPVDGLSSEDIRRIYSGEAENWSEFGGKNSGIQAFQRTENSGSQTALVGFMGGTPLMEPPSELVQTAMGEMIEIVSYENYRNALGFSFLFYATEMVKNNKIKLLEVDGVAPTRENVANGTYPYASEFYAVTAGTDNPNIQPFIDWILSPQGQELIEKTGYTPLFAND